MVNIPYLNTPDKPLFSTTQERIPIADIVQDIIIFRDGSASLVLESTSLNFGLLSTREQQAVIASYSGLLNSFNFPVQIAVRTQRKDISSYLAFLKKAQKKLLNKQLFNIMLDYENFIVEAVKKKNVLSKRFFVVIPFTTYELGVTKSLASIFSRKQTLPYPKSYVTKKAKIALYPKRDHLMRQAGRMGLELKQLLTPELVDLSYHALNPEPPLTKEETTIGKPII